MNSLCLPSVVLMQGLSGVGGSQAVSWVGRCLVFFVYMLCVCGFGVIRLQRVGEGSPILFDRAGLLSGGGWAVVCVPELNGRGVGDVCGVLWMCICVLLSYV